MSSEGGPDRFRLVGDRLFNAMLRDVGGGLLVLILFSVVLAITSSDSGRYVEVSQSALEIGITAVLVLTLADFLRILAPLERRVRADKRFSGKMALSPADNFSAIVFALVTTAPLVTFSIYIWLGGSLLVLATLLYILRCLYGFVYAGAARRQRLRVFEHAGRPPMILAVLVAQEAIFELLPDGIPDAFVGPARLGLTLLMLLIACLLVWGDLSIRERQGGQRHVI